METSLHYLEARRDQIRYAEFRAAGYPIGSGAVEGASKLVVEDRLNGAGMHRAPAHVDPMLALRNIVCNDRWDEACPQIVAQLRQQTKDQATARRVPRHQPLAQPQLGPPRPADHHPWRCYGQPLNPARQREAIITVN